ncbi:MAG: phospholipase D-like domain-containing protein [Candidatus Omnitrophota bacterium]
MKNSWNWAQARVLDASDRDYLETVLALFDGAKKEIVIALYLIEPSHKAEATHHPVNRLLEGLLRARKRGVNVRLVLNTNFRFSPKTEVGNGPWFERMTRAGIQITALLPSRRLHDKLIVIDGRYVMDGSMNWSEAALMSNFESATIVDSRAFAEKKLARIAAMTLPRARRRAPLKKEDPSRPLLEVPEIIQVPVAILGKDLLPKMIHDSDTRAADFYLLLLGQAEAAGTNSFEIDLETAGLALELPGKWTRSTVRRQMIKVLKKLSERYRLLDFKLPYAANAHIELKQLPGEGVRVPGHFLSAEYLAKVSTAETFLAIAGELLKKEGVAIDSLSAPELEKRFGIGKSAVVRTRKEMKSKVMERAK